MNNIFVFIIVALIVLGLALWCVSLLPFPHIVIAMLYVACIAGTAFAIARKAGWV